MPSTSSSISSRTTRSRHGPYPMTPDLIATAVTGDDEPGDDTVASASLSMNPPPRKPLPLRSRVNIPPPLILQSSTTGPLTQRSSLSSASAEIFDKQLVNDHNHVGPGFDMQARPPFVCLYRGCGKSFIQRSALTVHTRVHTGERPHRCECCHKPFADSSSLARHRRIHSGKRPYACKVAGCGRLFARRNTYLKHHKRQHPTLPPPSSTYTSVRTKPILSGYGSRLSAGTYFAPGPPDAQGPLYYCSTPSAAGHPHPFAAPYPSKGVAQPFIGGFHGASHSPGFDDQQHLDPSHGKQRQSRYTPTSTGDSGRISEPGPSSVQTPSPPGPPVHPPVFRQYSSIKSEQGFAAPVQGTHYHGFGPAQFSGGNVYPYGYLSHSVPHTSSGIGRVMKPESGHHHQQASSASSTIHRPYFQQQSPAAWGHVGGGFMPSQLAMPAPRQMLQPSYFQYAPVTTAPTDPGSTSTGHPASAPSATSYQAGSSSSPTSSGTGASRGITPEPLVDVHSASSFSFDQPSGPPISMPYSAVDHRHFNPLTHGPPQTAQVPAHFVRIASAPPNLLHFQSLPAVPTISGWDEIGPYHGPGGYGDAHSIGGGRSGEDEEWEDVDDLMGSHETSTSESMEENVAANSAATSVSSRTLPGHWSTPIAYPAPPARPPQESGRYPSSESSSSASSTLVSRSPHDAPFKPLPPTSGFASSTHPMALTPITPCGYYPPPATPVNISWGGHPKRQEVFENSAKMERSIDPARLSGPHRDEQSITLLTPPRLNRQESGPVTAVGLGIAGVSFRDRPEDVIERKESEESTVYPIPIEVEEEIDSDLEMAVDDVSDDDFVPGGSKRKSTKKGKRAKSAFRRASTKVGSK